MDTVRYSYRLRPGAAAVASLNAEWGRCRWLWNEAVHMQKTGQRPTFKRLCAELPKFRARYSWMGDGSSVAQNQTLRTYALALNQSFKVKGRGKPKFKKKKSRPSLQYNKQGFTLRDGVLKLPNKVSIPVIWSRDLPSEPTSARVFQDSLGHWYASFVVKVERKQAPLVNAEIGIDWGIKTTATVTDESYDLPYAGHRKRCAAELAKAQRKMSRRKSPKGRPNTKGYLEARRQTAKVHKKSQRQAQHTGRVWAKNVVDSHEFIAVEDFKPKFMFKSRLARKAADAAIGGIKRELVTRANQQGRTVVLVPPAYTTQTCSSCFARAKQRLELSDRTFLCALCFHKQGRDRNAANVVLAFAKAAQAGINLASVEGISQWLTLRSQALQPELGIPRL